MLVLACAAGWPGQCLHFCRAQGWRRHECWCYCGSPDYASFGFRGMISFVSVGNVGAMRMVSDLASCFLFSLPKTSEYAVAFFYFSTSKVHPTSLSEPPL